MQHIDRIERIKWLGTAIFLAAALVISAIAIGESRRANNTATEGEASADAVIGEDGWLYNVYIESVAEDSLCIWYDGQRYTLQGALASEYIGVADVEMYDGQVLQVNAKPETITGILDRYTDSKIQISGYEALEYSDELPVYVLQSEAEDGTLAGQKRLEDLVIGTSQVELVVAEGTACAIIQYQQDTYENIRVLIKNGSSLTYDNIYIISDEIYKVDDEESQEVTNVKKLLKDASNGDEIRVSPQNGLLYLCDQNGNISGDGYEGDFLVRKVKGGYVLVNDVAIETYLRYVLPSEMPTYFAYEALKAQAVCARTFAYKQMQTNAYAKYGANLDDSTAYQVYHASGTYDITDQAVLDTEGIVVTYEGELIDCYYYSTCPGYSENLEVWNTISPDYLVAENLTEEKTKDLSNAKNFHKFISESVESYDMDSPYYRWTAKLSAKMGMDEQYGLLEKLTVNERSGSGYILSLTVTFEQGERTYDTENEIRLALGKYISSVTLSDGTVRTDLSSLPSACFEVTSQKDGTIMLSGGGFGHGIGLSQYGADGMGQQGYTWQEIISYYYKGTTVQTVQ